LETGGRMSLTPKQSVLHAFQLVLYEKALHPGQLLPKARKVVRFAGYEFEAWVMAGSHVLRFERGDLCASELITEYERPVPTTDIVAAFYCPSEKDTEHTFARGGVKYWNSLQTETLPGAVFAETHREMLEFGRENQCLVHLWRDGEGECLSLVDIQRYPGEVHAQAWHLLAESQTVLRSQSLFEIGF